MTRSVLRHTPQQIRPDQSWKHVYKREDIWFTPIVDIYCPYELLYQYTADLEASRTWL